MTNISKESLLDLLYNKERSFNERVVVSPIIDSAQIGEGTIDLRLGTKFIFYKKQKVPILDPGAPDTEINIKKAQELFYCKYKDDLTLHPNEFVLGGSIEYVRLPNFISCHVVGRSSWGRLGLIIETSPIVHPCYMGIITFELINLGNTPIRMYPGCRIAQMSFYKTDKVEEYDCLEKYTGKYKIIPEPSFSKIYKDVEFEKIFKSKNQNSPPSTP